MSGGIVADWIGEGASYPTLRTAASTPSARPRSAKSGSVLGVLVTYQR